MEATPTLLRVGLGSLRDPEHVRRLEEASVANNEAARVNGRTMSLLRPGKKGKVERRVASHIRQRASHIRQRASHVRQLASHFRQLAAAWEESEGGA